MSKIVILGGGFGGVRTALELSHKLSKKEATITLIDKNNYHLFLPALYEIASAYGIGADRYQVKLRKAIGIPYSDIFNGTQVNFVQAEVARVDINKQEVETRGEEIFNYDHLVLGLGSETDTFEIPGAAEYAYKFRTIDDALFLNRAIIDLYEKAARGRHSLPIKFIIAGAGFNGIEMAGELACCIENVKNACKLHRGCVSIKIIEAGLQILPMISEKEREIIRTRLQKLGVEIIENAPIQEVGSGHVLIKNEAGEGSQEIMADFIIWTAGVRASSFIKNISGLRLDSHGRISVNRFLQAEDYQNIWALGDNTVFIDSVTQKPIPGLAYVAVDQGKVIADNIKRTLDKRTLKAYAPFYNVWIAPVGGKFAVAHLGPSLSISGIAGWLMRMLVDLRYFMSILPISKAMGLFEEETKIFTRND